MATAAARGQRDRNIAEYYPHQLSHRQRVFIGVDDYEAFYGGAAGGGKSDALIVAGLEFVHVPRYRAIIFRRTSPRLQELIDRSHDWLDGKADFNQQKLRWKFPSGAYLHFGHMQHEVDKYNFKTFEFQFVGWDELTEFTETQYTYLMSRIRGPECQLHKDNPVDGCNTCRIVRQLSKVPLRVRAASNPDGEGREWVKSRFVSDEAADAIYSGEYGELYYNDFERDDKRFHIPFVPSRSEDNPGISAEKYATESLSNLDFVTRQRLQYGDWKTGPDSPIKPDWLRYFNVRGDIICLLAPDGTPTRLAIDSRQCKRFATIDTAGTDRLKAEESRGKPPSYSALGVWDYWPAAKLLFLRHAWRQRVGWNELKATVPQILRSWGVRRVDIENAHFGPTLAAELGEFQVQLIPAMLPGMSDGYRGAKYERAAASGLLLMLENGQIVLPQEKSKWRADYEGELLGWNGTSDETTDQIDMSSYAAYHAKTAAVAWGGTSLKR